MSLLTMRHRQAERWQDEHIDELKQRRRYFERKYRRTRSGAYKRVYKLMCRCTNSAITTRHKEHFAEKIDVSSGSKMAWKQAQKLLSTTDEPTENSPTDTVKLCDSLQAFFNDKINKISLNISSLIASLQLPNLPHSTSCPKLQNSLTTFHQVTEDDVKRIITSSPPKTSGADVMPTWLLLQCLETLAPSFSRLFNLSLSSGVFPESFKSARVTPLIKKPGLDKTVYSNYRPISNLAFLGKTLERIVLEQLQCHMDCEPALNPNQSAYRRLHSTETALNRITNDILSPMDNRKVTIMSMFDFSAAFDTIDHQILLERLTINFNITQTVLHWLSSFLTDRQQTVYIGQSHASSSATVSRGVPQGSVLGSVLYAMYTSPIYHIVRDHGLNGHQYADDTQILISCHVADLQSTITRVEACVGDMVRWLLLNNLCLNSYKTELLLFGTKQQLAKVSQAVQLNVSTDVIKCTQSARNLGVWLDDKLIFDIQAGQICQSCMLNIKKLAKIRRYLTPQSAAVLGAAIVASKLDYCNSILTGISSTNIQRLQRIQYALARVIHRVPWREHITPTITKLHWLPVQQRIHFNLALLTWKALHLRQPSYLAELLNQRSTNGEHNLRDRGIMLVLPPTSTQLGDRAFSCAAPRLWNSLPASVRSSPSLPSFKSNLKT